MQNVKAGLVALGLTLVPTAGAALSCQEYAIRNAYWDHEARTERYVLVLGAFSNLTLVERVETRTTGEELRPGRTTYEAQFSGFKPSRRAFDVPFETEVVLVFPDFSMIGGGYDSAAAVDMLPGQSGLIWLQETDAGYRLEAELCAPLIDTDPASVTPALRCLAGADCPKPG